MKDRQVHGGRGGPLPEVWAFSRDAQCVNASSSYDVAVSGRKSPTIFGTIYDSTLLR
jgi:hypothetical protein